MRPRVTRHPDPSDDVIPVEAFEEMDGPLIQGFLKNVSAGKREKMHLELARNTPIDRRFMIFPKQQGIDGDDGNKLESVTIDQTQFGVCDIMGMRNSQEDSVSCAVMPGFKLLTQAEQDLVAKTTFAKMQTKHGKESLGIGSTMTVATAWKTPKEGGGYRVNTHTAYVGDSPAFIVIIKADGTIVCRKLNRSSHHPDPNKGWQGASNYNQETERHELPRTKFPLTKAIGDIDVEGEGLTHEPTIDHYDIDIGEDDKVFIVTGCDGMTEDLNNDDAQEEAVIGQIVSAHRNKPAHEIAKELAKRSATQGTKDNISCAVFEVTEDCASLNVNDGHGGQKIAKALRDEIYPTMMADIARELEYKDKIDALLKQISRAAIFYLDLGRETNITDFSKLLRKLKKLNKNREDRSNEQTFQQMFGIIEDAFSKAEGKYRSRHPANRSTNAFAEVINENTDEYHYPRVLALILNANSSTPPSSWLTWGKVNYSHYAELRVTTEKEVVIPPDRLVRPPQSNVIFNNLIDDILDIDFTFSEVEIEAMKTLLHQAKPETLIGFIKLLNEKVQLNEPVGFAYSRIPQVIKFMKMDEALNSLARELITHPVSIMIKKSDGADADKYSGFGADEAIPLTIMLLNKYHKAQIPALYQKITALQEKSQHVTGGAEYGLTNLSSALGYINDHPGVDFTPSELTSQIPNEKKRRETELFYTEYLQTTESTSLQDALNIFETMVPIGDTDHKAVISSLQFIFSGTQSQEEINLSETLKSDRNINNIHNNINTIINLVKSARDSYLQLGRSTHQKDFDKLIASLTRIANDSKGYKETRMYGVIEAAYHKEQKPPMSISRLFRSDSENAEKFKDKINKNQKIFHYPRMLAVIMQHPALRKACETEEVRMNAAYHKVRPTIRSAYRTIAPITTDYQESLRVLNAALKKILNVQDISKLAFRTREIDNAVKYGATILPAKRVNQIAEILEKQTRFPSFLIADMLNELINQMRDPLKVFNKEDVKAIAQRCCGTDPRLDAVASFWGDMIEDKDIDRVSNYLFDIITPLKVIVANDVSLPQLKGLEQQVRPAL